MQFLLLDPVQTHKIRKSSAEKCPVTSLSTKKHENNIYNYLGYEDFLFKFPTGRKASNTKEWQQKKGGHKKPHF